MKKPRKSLYIAVDYELGKHNIGHAIGQVPKPLKQVDDKIRSIGRVGETFVYELVLHKVVKGVVTYSETLEPEKPLRPEVQALYDKGVERVQANDAGRVGPAMWNLMSESLRARCLRDSRYPYHAEDKDLGPFLEYLDSVWDDVYPPKAVTESPELLAP